MDQRNLRSIDLRQACIAIGAWRMGGCMAQVRSLVHGALHGHLACGMGSRLTTEPAVITRQTTRVGEPTRKRSGGAAEEAGKRCVSLSGCIQRA